MTEQTSGITLVTVESKPSKVGFAEKIYKEVKSRHAAGTLEMPRKTYIKQVQLPVDQGGCGMSPAYAQTSWQNFEREAKGGKRYVAPKKKEATSTTISGVESSTGSATTIGGSAE